MVDVGILMGVHIWVCCGYIIGSGVGTYLGAKGILSSLMWS